jgi:hypothetical protein
MSGGRLALGLGVRLYSLLWSFFKPVGLFAGGLYLLGFGLFPVAKGLQDFLLPFEQKGCLILGCCFLIWFIVSYYRLWGVLRNW